MNDFVKYYFTIFEFINNFFELDFEVRSLTLKLYVQLFLTLLS